MSSAVSDGVAGLGASVATVAVSVALAMPLPLPRPVTVRVKVSSVSAASAGIVTCGVTLVSSSIVTGTPLAGVVSAQP